MLHKIRSFSLEPNENHLGRFESMLITLACMQIIRAKSDGLKLRAHPCNGCNMAAPRILVFPQEIWLPPQTECTHKNSDAVSKCVHLHGNWYTLGWLCQCKERLSVVGNIGNTQCKPNITWDHEWGNFEGSSCDKFWLERIVNAWKSKANQDHYLDHHRRNEVLN